MNRFHTLAERSPRFALSALVAGLLAACGGGGGEDRVGIDDATATLYSAEATQIHSDAVSAADSAVLAAQAMIGAGAGMLGSDGRSEALAAGAAPLATSTRTCPGGGTATASITGGAPGSQANGKFDTGEVYQVTFAACLGAAGVARVDGTLALTVQNASGDSVNGALDLATTATDLALTLPRGSVTLNGSTQRQFTVATDTDGTVHLTSRFVAPSVVLQTHYNARTSTFTLSNADIARTATVVGGALQSSSIDGTHTINAVLPNASFGYTVATTGTVTYAADGVPTSGSWILTLPQNLITVTVANQTATITIDHDKDGSIDRTITLPARQLANGAG